MSRLPVPSQQAYDAAIARAQAAEKLAADRLDALQAVRDAIGIPNPATVGDEAARLRILGMRAMITVVCLDRLTGDQADREDIAWGVAYLREQLEKHPPAYRTWEQAVEQLQEAKP